MSGEIRNLRGKGDVGMAEAKRPEKGGLCCPHCADSKFPCVTMEKQMRRGGNSGKEEFEEGEKSRARG